MISSRRNFLKILGGGTVVAAAGMGTFLSTRTPEEALAPWDNAGNYQDVRKWALSYALLAPNPHNRQPWQVDLSTPNQITIYRDKEKDLRHTDPFSRQLTIGMGCFLELLSIAATHVNQRVSYQLFPEGENGPVAVATFIQGANADPLFYNVMKRRSCKEPFTDKLVANELVQKLNGFANVIIEPKQVATLQQLSWDAWLVEANTERTWKESVDLMRIGKAEINANPDGIDLGGPLMESLKIAGIMTRESQLDKTSSGYKEGREIYQKMLKATQAYCTIITAGNSRVDQIDAGRRWLRLNLQTTGLGLSLHPISQVLQEYPEMSEHYNKAHSLLAQPGHTVQMFARLGFGPSISRTPRWPLEAKIING
ncbi:Acg family FMN-binding oxidoreductase [Marinomonas colpomeniae]|uniref:Twin-arginine translocation pathway signal protein n=1 Tax=Marinomonas colpomeniae TaxID=2774408 RepID=A0ABR8P3V4_9GAMM|nr:twin-arginine translocation pathway signal protein [Marinomonas colpomeniae]MBD5771472.1 twin-arginine translocation pathway signal protein [Marinomonas colpomeniae]